MNILQMAQNKPRYSQMDKNMWDMILGRTGKLPGTVAPEIVELAKEKGFEFFEGTPQDNYPDELPKYREMMKENGWDFGQDDEELFELAMHERQYMDYKSGTAKRNFEREVETALKSQCAPVAGSDVNPAEMRKQKELDRIAKNHPNAKPVTATVAGTVIWQLAVNEPSMEPPIGTSYKEGDTVCHVSAYYGNEEIKALYSGKLILALVKQGDKVAKGDIVAYTE